MPSNGRHTVGPWSACKEIGDLCLYSCPQSCRDHCQSKEKTSESKHCLPQSTLHYLSLISSCTSVFTYVNCLILLVIFYQSYFFLSHSILKLLPLYLKVDSCFSYHSSPWNCISMEASQIYTSHMKTLTHHHSGTLSLLSKDIPLMHSLCLLTTFSTMVR